MARQHGAEIVSTYRRMRGSVPLSFASIYVRMRGVVPLRSFQLTFECAASCRSNRFSLSSNARRRAAQIASTYVRFKMTMGIWRSVLVWYCA